MPVFKLTDELVFPPPGLAEDNGLLAFGGDLSPARVLLAYSMGIFPWFGRDDPILWWSPSPRLVLFPEEFKVSRRLARLVRQNRFRVTMDHAFHQVIMACATVERRQDNDTWITPEMIQAYESLHHQGYGHSVECWAGGELAGGLYGIGLGDVFFGESMFSRVDNASKVALVTLVEYLKKNNCRVIDCQVKSDHLLGFGAREIPGDDFLALLKTN